MKPFESADDTVREISPSAIELPPTEPIDIRAWITMQDGAERATWSVGSGS
ncbi:MAG: hypothetical protein QOD05_120 [Microbacteriaceae bacterium]|jgi:hypothetical protein|nr:hypothetical protein [Microbacteriaceae bacterium]